LNFFERSSYLVLRNIWVDVDGGAGAGAIASAARGFRIWCVEAGGGSGAI
jgi:hypothetical protein